MKLFKILLSLGAMASVMMSCKKDAELKIMFPERFEGKTVELIDYKDSTLIATSLIKNGEAEFTVAQSDSLKLPMFMQLCVDGRICAYYIAESGKAMVSDSTNVATGTKLNDKFASLIATLDSIEDTDDMYKYIEYTEQQYNANIGNPIGDYFGIEWMKYAEPEKVDSMLATVSPSFRNSRRVKHYEKTARLRLNTSPGHKYVDFEGKTSTGTSRKLSDLIPSGKYTIIDFWASWCPYCIKELPDLKKLRAEFGNMVEIVGVAVRDLPEDTKAMIKKQQIDWPVLYNTQKIPYDIYGFSGIPHHILVSPDGTILSRGENIDQLRKRLEQIVAQAEINK
ncbi:MAG: TlpA family protein disulfide reductase [Bacteroidales bacterium]|nr:TlpA family protein disulfide reductase [Bacteroidales bacterium]